jgi:hypothetical protein
VASDLFSGLHNRRDWSIGAGSEPAHPPAALKRIEAWTPAQVLEMAQVVRKEIAANVGLVKKAVTAKTIDPRDAQKFGQFVAEWKKYEDTLSPPVLAQGATADRLRHWRGLNAEWTQRLSHGAAHAATTVREARMLMVVVSRRTVRPSKWPLLAAVAGALGLGYWLNRKG